MKALPVSSLEELEDRVPAYALVAGVELMTVVARAAGHRHLSEFSVSDLTSFDTDMCRLAGVAYGGVSSDSRGDA